MVFTKKVGFVEYESVEDSNYSSPKDVSMPMEVLDATAETWQPTTEWEVDFKSLNTKTFSSFKREMFSYLTWSARENNQDEYHHEIMAIFAWVWDYSKYRSQKLVILNELQWQLLRHTILHCDLEVEFRINPDENEDGIGNTEPPLPDITEEMKSSKDYWHEGWWNRLPFQRSRLPKTGRSWNDIR